MESADPHLICRLSPKLELTSRFREPRSDLFAITPCRALRTPDIFNTDQGAQFTSRAFTSRVLAAGIRCSMDGRGAYLDNIFVERLWRSLKYEAVYLHELTDGLQAERLVGSWFSFYNTSRPHSALGGRTPQEARLGMKAAA